MNVLATFNRSIENIRVETVVVPELKFRDVQRYETPIDGVPLFRPK